MFNVFTDFHHASLLQSLILLFEKRLGGLVLRPIGMEWAEEGYWRVYDHPATQAQYLSVGATPVDGTPPLNQLYKTEIIDKAMSDEMGIYMCQDIDSGTYNRAITLKTFMSCRIDIVVASLPQHIEPFLKLCEVHPNHPKLIYQIGNAWELPAGVPVKNVMASANIPNIPADINFIQYHQEFNTEVFKPSLLTIPPKNIFSFVNCFGVSGHLQADYKLFTDVERLMPEWNFKTYGGQCRDGAVGPATLLAETMQNAKFIWHTKNGGDGYGHVIHNAAAVGRPLITKRSYYGGKMGESLMIDGQTCIDVDNLSPQNIIEKINYYSDPSRYVLMCDNIYKAFQRNCDFNCEELKLRDFLSKLI